MNNTLSNKLCPTKVHKMASEAQELLDESLRVLVSFKRLEDKSYHSMKHFVNRIISIYDEHNNRILPNYLSTIKNWKNLELTDEQKEYIDVIEKCIAMNIKSNKEILSLARSCKTKKSASSRYGFTLVD